MSKYLIVVALLLMIIVNTLAEDKLQIGIKKKVDNCDTNVPVAVKETSVTVGCTKTITRTYTAADHASHYY